MKAIVTGQPSARGTRIRTSRFFTNPPTPLRSSIMRAKKPAIRKKVVIRNTWMTKKVTARPVLLAGSSAGDVTNGGTPGR